MDEKLRRLERQAATGDLNALHRLFAYHLRIGILKPVDPLIVEQRKTVAQRAAKAIELQERRRNNKRMTAAQRKRAREQRKRAGGRHYHFR
jgi:hypothetical protein